MGRKFYDSIPNLIFLAVLGIIVYYLLKFIRIVFSSIENETVTIGDFDPIWAKPGWLEDL